MNTTHMIVVGSRSYSDRAELYRVCDSVRTSSVVYVVSGGALGADSLGVAWARSRGLLVREFPADWGRFGRSAGFRRTAELLAWVPSSSVVVCFVDRLLADCRGSVFTVGAARRRGLPVVTVEVKSGLRYSIRSLFDVQAV